MSAWGFGFGDGNSAWDLIVDDGVHTPHDQLATLANLFRYLAPGGLYVVEDVNEGKDLLKRAHKALTRIVGSSPFFFVDGFLNETTGRLRHGSALLVIRKM